MGFITIILKSIILTCVILVGIGLIQVYLIPHNIQSYEECGNMSFVSSMECLNDYTNSFYFYNKSNENVSSKVMTFEDLKEHGGVCKHYAHFYEEWGEEIGYDVVHVSLPRMQHGFSVIYDNATKNYCVLDQEDIIGCWS